MKKLFFVAGELSGDRLAAWYLKRLKAENQGLHVEAVGGDFLVSAGAYLHQRFETLNVVGVYEIIKHLPSLVKTMHHLATYVVQNKFDHVVFVDFPGFNLRLAKLLKKKIRI